MESAIEALGYQPNRAARRLRANSSDVLGLIVPDILNPLFVAVARGVEDEAYKHELNVMLCNSDDNTQKQQAYLRILQAERAAGIIIAPTHIDDGAALEDHFPGFVGGLEAIGASFTSPPDMAGRNEVAQ